MRTKFDMQLEQLNDALTNMGTVCENAIADAVEALLKNDKMLADEAIKTEKDIDNSEKEIESLCFKILLQQQPVAKDLRLISAALKMITDMERIGDQAADIAEIITFTDLSSCKNKSHIKDMANAVIKMVRESITAFVEHDMALAREAIDYDDVVDGLFDEVKHDVVQIISQENALGQEAIDILMIAKYLERIGDHAANISEWVEFSITGVHRDNVILG